MLHALSDPVSPYSKARCLFNQTYLPDGISQEYFTKILELYSVLISAYFKYVSENQSAFMVCQWGQHAPNSPIQITGNVQVVNVVHPHKQVLKYGLLEMETRELNATTLRCSASCDFYARGPTLFSTSIPYFTFLSANLRPVPRKRLG